MYLLGTHQEQTGISNNAFLGRLTGKHCSWQAPTKQKLPEMPQLELMGTDRGTKERCL